MTATEPHGDHPEAITLGLHDASPQHMVDAMADDVVLELGWGRLIFGQTFAEPDKLAEVLRQEGRGRRDICIYAREPQVLVAMAPAELFIDPSHTYRLRFSDDEPEAKPETRNDTIGVDVQDLTPELAEQLNMKDDATGVVLTKVHADSPAERAGIQEGDLIIGFDGHDVPNIDVLHKLLTDRELGVPASLTILRYPQKIVLAVVPDSR